MSPNSILSAAQFAISKYGLSVIPVGADDWEWLNPVSEELETLHKRPAYQNGKGPTPLPWDAFKSRRMNDKEQKRYFTDAPKMGVVCGQVSGGLEVIDFDAAGFYESWRELLIENGFDELLKSLVIQKTPRKSGGFHVIYRCTAGIAGNQKCARWFDPESKDPTKPSTAIETRGEGGYIVCFPSEGYTMRQGTFAAIPDLSSDDRDALLQAARLLTDYIEEHPTPVARELQAKGTGELPGDDFNRRGEADALRVLLAHGFKEKGSKPPLINLVRPGKDKGFSATYGYRSRAGIPMLYNFSSNAHPFDVDKAYSPFAIVAMIEHGGDFSKAASALSKQGYGSPKTRVQAPSGDGPKTKESQDVSQPANDPVFRFLTTAELMALPPKPMLITGLLGVKDRAMMFGIPGVGKTFVVTDLMIACAVGGRFAAQFQVERELSVVYCTNEGRSGYPSRLKACLAYNGIRQEQIESNLTVCFDMPQLSNPKSDRAIREFADAWANHVNRAMDVLVIDTLNQATLGADENDNAAAAIACHALAEISELLDTSSLLVHHPARSSSAPRGASAYDGAMDLVLRVFKEDGDPHSSMRLFKGKDIQRFDDVAFKLEGHESSAVVHWLPDHGFDPRMVNLEDETAKNAAMLYMINHDREWWTLTAIANEIPHEYYAIKQALWREAGKPGGLFIKRGSGEAVEYKRRGYVDKR